MLTWDIKEYNSLMPIQDLTPQNCFIGSFEVIPGLIGDKFPKPRQSSN